MRNQYTTPLEERYASSTEAAERIVMSKAPIGCEPWRGTLQEYAAALRDHGAHMLPWWILITEETRVSLHARSISGAIRPEAICRISKVVVIELERSL